MKEKLLMLGVCLFLATCSEPEGPEPLPPIKEKFVWQLDTIRYPGASQFVVRYVFGTSDGNVYVAAMGNAGACGMFWKYADSTWTVIELNEKYRGPLKGRVAHLSDLDGTGGNRVWMTGTRRRDTILMDPPRALVVWYGFLASYDGRSFSEVDLYNEPEMTCLDVVTDNDIWFGSVGPHIYHFDGVDVQKYPLPMEKIKQLSVHPIQTMATVKIARYREELFVVVSLQYNDPYGAGRVQLRSRDLSEWEIVEYRTDGNSSWSGGMHGYWLSPEGTLYSGGDHVYKYEQGKWQPLHWTVVETNQVFGSSNRDIWAVGEMTNVTRCVDGKWISNEFFRIPDAHKTTSWLDGWTDGDRVFIVGNPDQDSMDYGVVAHGR